MPYDDKMGNAMMAGRGAPSNAMADRPLVDRMTMLPIGQYEDGSLTLAWPSMLKDMYEGAVRSFEQGRQLPRVDEEGFYAGTPRAEPLDGLNAASIAPMAGVGMRAAGMAREAPAAASSAAAPRMRLLADQPDLSLPSQAPFEGRRLAYDIANGAGDDAGRVELTIGPDGQAYIEHVVMGDSIGGTRGARDFLRLLKAEHPEVTNIFGDRVSGARAASGDVRQSIDAGRLFANDSRAALPGVVVNGVESAQPSGYRLVGGPGETVSPEFSPTELLGQLVTAHGDLVPEVTAQYRLSRRLGDGPFDAARAAFDYGRDMKRDMRSSWYDAFQDSLAGDRTPFHYDITDNAGTVLGSADGKVAGDTMWFDWLGGSHYNPADLGVRGVRQLREQVRRDFPNVKKFEGVRVSGARESKQGSDALQSVILPANPETASFPSLLMSGEGEEQGNAMLFANADPAYDADALVREQWQDLPFVQGDPSAYGAGYIDPQTIFDQQMLDPLDQWFRPQPPMKPPQFR